LTKEQYLAQLDEKQLFQLMKEYLPQLIDLNENDQYSATDWYLPTENSHWECKCRKEHYNGLVIEKKKYNAIINLDKIYYINSTPKGIYVFDLKKIEEPSWFDKYMNKTTEFGEQIKIQKDSGLIHISKATFQLDHLILPKIYL